MNEYQKLCIKIADLEASLKARMPEFTFWFHKLAYERAIFTIDKGLQQDFYGAIFTVYSNVPFSFRYDVFVTEYTNIAQTADDIVTLYNKNKTLNQIEDKWWE